MKLLLLSLALATCFAAGSIDYIEALSKIPNLGQLYADDGAGDGTVMIVGADDSGTVVKPLPAVKAIVGLGPRALPLLIDCLTDTRASSATFRLENGTLRPVPVGYICLDILKNIVADPADKVFEKDCADDGLGACINPDYYFRPDVVEKHRLQLVRQSWTAALTRRIIRFRYPRYWRGAK